MIAPQHPRADFDPVPEWQSIVTKTPPAIAQRISALVHDLGDELAEAFYAEMLAHPKAKLFLDADIVHQRLHASMRRWLGELFAPHPPEALPAIVAHQRYVGEVHARIQLPMHLVARGARFLKGRLLSRLLRRADNALDADQTEAALRYVNDLFDLALELMAESYVRDTQRVARTEEAFRLHALSQNLQVERERQRFLLAAWGQEVLFALHRGGQPLVLPTLRGSEFGLWFLHKGANLFEGAPEVELVHAGLDHIDGTLLPQLQAGDAQRQPVLITELQTALDNLQYLVQMLFERHIELESGRDALTRLLNRRFLGPILAREVHLAQQRRIPFALLLLDLDHFKLVNDQHGHDAGDAVLQQTALLLLNHVRASDFVFRYGGEEFLIVLVDVTPEQALHHANKLRQRVAEHGYELPGGATLRLTTSIGVAPYQGHPDYQYLIRQADTALYEAKRGGRNRVVLAGGAAGGEPTIGA